MWVKFWNLLTNDFERTNVTMWAIREQIGCIWEKKSENFQCHLKKCKQFDCCSMKCEQYKKLFSPEVQAFECNLNKFYVWEFKLIVYNTLSDNDLEHFMNKNKSELSNNFMKDRLALRIALKETRERFELH